MPSSSSARSIKYQLNVAKLPLAKALLGELFLNGGGAQADLRAEAPRITTSIGRGS
jgi:hypothetical protein